MSLNIFLNLNISHYKKKKEIDDMFIKPSAQSVTAKEIVMNTKRWLGLKTGVKICADQWST